MKLIPIKEVIKGHDIGDVSQYIDPGSPKQERMAETIRHNLGVTTLRCQTVDDMVEAVGQTKDKLCQYCGRASAPKLPAAKL